MRRRRLRDDAWDERRRAAIPTGTLIRKHERQPDAEDVRLDQQPTDQLAEDGGQPHRKAIRGKGLRQRPSPEGRAENRQHLRGEQRGGQPLDHPRADQRRGRRSQPAGGGREGEQAESEAEHPAPAEHVAEPAGGDDACCHGQPETGDDPLHAAVAGVQIVLTLDGMATFTMKTSSVDMKTPVSTSSSVGQCIVSRGPGAGR